MNKLAEDWDYIYGKSVKHHIIKDDQFIPINRPCDWCGDIVEEGYIHKHCLKEECETMLEILL